MGSESPGRLKTGEKSESNTSTRFRFFGKPTFRLGHLGKDLNKSLPNADYPYMDENAVRARAGLLNITSWIALINLLHWQNKTLVFILFPLVAWDMFSASVFGLTPFSPYGVAGTALANVFWYETPNWKPAIPKRFAWIIGLCLVSTCFLGFLLRLDDADSDSVSPGDVLVWCSIIMCSAATWLEAAMGFCLGCCIYNHFIVAKLKLAKPCEA